MKTSTDQLQNLLETKKALKLIREKMDPASGVSFSARRGVSWDNPDQEDDSERRPWVTTEVADEKIGEQIMDLLIQSTDKRIAFWINAVECDIAKAQQVLAFARGAKGEQ